MREAQRACSKQLGGATSGPLFKKAMLEALSPPAVLAGIRRHATFASLAALEAIKNGGGS